MKQIITSPAFIIPSLTIASFYLIITTYLMNAELVWQTIFGNFPYSYKVNLLIALLQGMWTAMSGTGLVVLIITSLLTGANISLLLIKISILRKSGNIHFLIGGSTLFGVIGSGCASCGLPVLALLGLTGSVAFLPLRGMELSYISILLLSGSLYLLIRSINQVNSCEINLKPIKV